MLRNKHRKANIATLPFRIRNNFRRLSNRFFKSQDILSDNEESETMLQKDSEDDNVSGKEHNTVNESSDDDDRLEQRSDDDGYLEQRLEDSYSEQRSSDGYLEQQSNNGYLEQRSDNVYFDQQSDDDHLEQRSNNESDVNMILTSSESETENDYVMFSESDEDYETSSSDNEESSESDEDYSTTSSDNEERYDVDTSSEEKLFVDTALAGDKLSSFDGDFAPYFQDLTTAALFCWINKHNISTNAYEDLVDIIMRPEFNRDHIVKNIRRFRA
jgi:hypothetical protein